MLCNNIWIYLQALTTTGAFAVESGADAGTGAEAGTKLDKRVRGEAGRHSVRFMAGR